MKVLIADKLANAGLERLREAGMELVVEPGCSADSLPASLQMHEPDALVVRSTRVTAAAVEAGRRLKLIVRAGAGYDTIDRASASKAGVFVANCPGKNAIAVAELTWGLILACDRRVADQTAELREGTWNKKTYAKSRGIYGRTLGVIGTGRIGREVILRAHAFGTPVIAWSRGLDDEMAHKLGVRRADSVLAVASEADILTLHVASTAETRHLVSDQAVCGTHHIGASTDQAQDATALEAARVIEYFAQSGNVDNCVNLAQRSDATTLLTVRHFNRPGVLANVFQVLSESRINVEEMDNILYEGATTACARIRLSQVPRAADLELIRERCSDILSIELSALASPADTH
jgi:D-3-phosphoglycerate dehydrogenase